MSWTRESLKNPAAVAVIVAIIALLGVTTIVNLPLKLFPDIERPQIGIRTAWRAASPQEIESEITEPLEEVMRGLPGLQFMGTWSQPGMAWLNLEFSLETDMDQTLIDVIGRINRLPPLPADANPPQVMMGGGGGGGSDETLIYLFVQALPSAEHPIAWYKQYIEDEVLPQIESVPGVSRTTLNAGAGGAEELQIIFDPFRAAQLGLDLNDMAASIGRPVDTSGGFIDVGRRRYMLSVKGKYSVEELSGKILAWRNGRPVHLGDVAEVKLGSSRDSEVVYQNGNPALGISVGKESRANVLSTLAEVTTILDRLNAGELKDKGLYIEKSFDPSVFIKRAINLLAGNLLIGTLLAIGALWWFLRQGRATLIIAVAIPISLLATLIVLGLAGRTLNVISLAGLAFATGMVLDAAIVVLENIVRMREKGSDAHEASEQGAGQVWGALLASTATTVAIFIPIMFLKDVEGQLFADLALTIAIGVAVSLIVAVTVLPVAAKHFLQKLPPSDAHAERWVRVADRIMWLTGSTKRRLGWLLGLTVVPAVAMWMLWPSLNYLPPVKRDAVDAFIMFPAGANAATVEEEIISKIVERIQPYMDGTKEPALKNYYFISFPNGAGGNMGVRAKDQGRVAELEKILKEEILVGFPDVFVMAQQGNLFGNFGSSDSISIRMQSKDADALREASIAGMQIVQDIMPGARVQAQPDPSMSSAELQITPNDRRLAEVGWNRNDIARIIRALGNGLWLGEYFNGDRRLDIVMKAEEWNSPEALQSMPVYTPRGGIIPLGDLVTIERGVGPAVIQRVNGRRTVRLEVNPPEGMPLADAIDIIKTQVEPKLRPLLPADGTIGYGGSADSLERAVKNLVMNAGLALGLLFMILAALFKSPKDAMMVVLTIPLATVGGVVAINILDIFTFAPMDLLTMIGFIILLGLVVNNAILLVAQTRRSEEEGLSRPDAVRRALQLRLRPIFMSTITSIMGMLPLVIFAGPGSAIYRGMATAIVGGMAVSTVFTLLLLPSLLMLGSDLTIFNKKPSAPAKGWEGHAAE